MATHEDPVRDPASGYMSGDVLDPAAEINRDRSGEVSEERDPGSGYANADLLQNRGAPPAPRRDEAQVQESERDALSGYASADVLDQ